MESELIDTLTGRFIESDSKEFEVVLIEAGKSLNGIEYTPELLKKSVKLFDKAKCFAYELNKKIYDHLPQDLKDKMPYGIVKNLVGYFKEPRFTEFKKEDGSLGQGIVAKFKVTASWLKDHLREMLKDGLDALNKMFGFSIDAEGIVSDSGEALELTRVDSVDIVTHPAAGGRFLRVLASRFLESIKEGEMDLELLYELVYGEKLKDEDRQEWERTFKEIQEARERGEDIARIIDALKKKKKKTEYPEPDEYPEPCKENTKDIMNKADEVLKQIEDKLKALESLEIKKYLEEALSNSGLSEPIKNYISGLTFSTKESIDETIKKMKEIETNFEQNKEPLIRVEESEGESVVKMIDDIFDGKASLREAYIKFTGDSKITGRISECYQSGKRRMTESLSSSDWAEALGDSIRRFMLKEYSLPDLQVWKNVVSDIVPLKDYRTHRWVRIGGYGELPEVGERGTYTELTSPEDEEITMTPKKYGGIETITIEMIKNDDILAVKRIPIKLGRAAARSVYNGVFGIFTTNPLYIDGYALFSSQHSNLLSGAGYALNSSSLMSARQLMARQRETGSNEYLNLRPRWLLVPPELEDMAFRLCTSPVYVNPAEYASGSGAAEASTTPNIISQKFRTDFITVASWSDANDWVAICDPKDCPTIVVGFLDGNQEPDILIQDNPSYGSMFTADKISYKVRIVWGVAVADYRGMVKASV